MKAKGLLNNCDISRGPTIKYTCVLRGSPSPQGRNTESLNHNISPELPYNYILLRFSLLRVPALRVASMRSALRSASLSSSFASLALSRFSLLSLRSLPWYFHLLVHAQGCSVSLVPTNYWKLSGYWVHRFGWYINVPIFRQILAVQKHSRWY